MKENWRRRALCRQYDTEMFFEENKGRYADQQVHLAKKICGQCEVRLACRAYALHWHQVQGDLYGVFGGMTQKERKELLKT